MENALKIDASAFQNAIHMNMTQEELAELMKSSMLSSTSTYDGNLQSLGYADLDDPSTISIYPKDFDCKGPDRGCTGRLQRLRRGKWRG